MVVMIASSASRKAVGALALVAVALLQEDRERDVAVLDALDRGGPDRIGLDEPDVRERGFRRALRGARNASQMRSGQLLPAKNAVAVTPSGIGSRARGSR